MEQKLERKLAAFKTLIKGQIAKLEQALLFQEVCEELLPIISKDRILDKDEMLETLIQRVLPNNESNQTNFNEL